jgi:hypothetical protein
MSAFVVGEDTMNRVVRAIVCSGHIRRFGDFDTAIGTNARAIGRALYAMNIEAIMQRYPDCRTDPDNMPGWQGCEMMPTTYYFGNFRRPMREAELVICLKAMHCLSYQCSEGDVPKTPLFKALEEACGVIAGVVVTSLPGYQSAPWGD